MSPAQLRQLAANRFTCSRKADWCEKAATALAEVAGQMETLLDALEAGPSVEHDLPSGRQCSCSQCQFVRMRRAAITKATTPTTT